MKGSPSKPTALKVDVLWDQKIYCLQMHVYILQALAVKGLNGHGSDRWVGFCGRKAPCLLYLQMDNGLLTLSQPR